MDAYVTCVNVHCIPFVLFCAWLVPPLPHQILATPLLKCDRCRVFRLAEMSKSLPVRAEEAWLLWDVVGCMLRIAFGFDKSDPLAWRTYTAVCWQLTQSRMQFVCRVGHGELMNVNKNIWLTFHSTQNRSFRRCSSLPVSWRDYCRRSLCPCVRLSQAGIVLKDSTHHVWKRTVVGKNSSFDRYLTESVGNEIR